MQAQCSATQGVVSPSLKTSRPQMSLLSPCLPRLYVLTDPVPAMAVWRLGFPASFTARYWLVNREPATSGRSLICSSRGQAVNGRGIPGAVEGPASSESFICSAGGRQSTAGQQAGNPVSSILRAGTNEPSSAVRRVALHGSPTTQRQKPAILSQFLSTANNGIELFSHLLLPVHLRDGCMQARPCWQTCPSSPGQVPQATKGVRGRQQTAVK